MMAITTTSSTSIKPVAWGGTHGNRSLLARCYTEDDTTHNIAKEMNISPAALTMRPQRIRHAVVQYIEQTLGKKETA